MVFVEGGLRRLEEPVDGAIGIGTGKAIDSRSRSRPRSPRRDRSPFFGGPASREVILEGLPLDMVEDDVGHHLPV